MQYFTIILQALALTAAISIDAFAAGFAYGSNQIKIPFRSMQAINLICAGVLAFSLLAGHVVRPWLPAGLTAGISFAILFLMGSYKLAGSITKIFLQKHSDFNREFAFSAFNLKFILHLCAKPEAADLDGSRVLTLGEAAALAVALSLDGLAVGFGAAMGSVNVLAAILCSLVVGFFAIWLGCLTGHSAAKKLPFDLSWLGGAMLIGLAVVQLV